MAFYFRLLLFRNGVGLGVTKSFYVPFFQLWVCSHQDHCKSHFLAPYSQWEQSSWLLAGPCLGQWSWCSQWWGMGMNMAGEGMCWCLWPMLPLKAMGISVACASTWRRIDIWRLCYHLGHIDVYGLPAVCAAVWGHVDVHGPGCNQGPCCYPWSCYPGGHADVLGLSCCLRLWWCLWPKLWQKVVLISVAYTSTKGLSVYWCWRPSGCLQSMISPEAMV